MVGITRRGDTDDGSKFDNPSNANHHQSRFNLCCRGIFLPSLSHSLLSTTTSNTSDGLSSTDSSST